MLQKAVCSLVKATELCNCRYFEEALPYIVNVHKLNRRILRKVPENLENDQKILLIADVNHTMNVLRKCIKVIDKRKLY